MLNLLSILTIYNAAVHRAMLLCLIQPYSDVGICTWQCYSGKHKPYAMCVCTNISEENLFFFFAADNTAFAEYKCTADGKSSTHVTACSLSES